MSKHHFQPRGVCSRAIEFDLEDGILHNIRFSGGCSGNTQGLAALCEGMSAKEAAERLAGIRCGFKSTSCPDQLSIAIREAIEQA